MMGFKFDLWPLIAGLVGVGAVVGAAVVGIATLFTGSDIEMDIDAGTANTARYAEVTPNMVCKKTLEFQGKLNEYFQSNADAPPARKFVMTMDECMKTFAARQGVPAP